MALVGRGIEALANGPVVLLVEDNRDMAQAMVQCLRASGYQPVWAEDGAEALRLCEQHPVAMVLLDWRLPGELHGPALVQRLRARSQRLPVVVISADPAALTEASQCGVQDYLPKPFQLADLIHVVDEYCQ